MKRITSLLLTGCMILGLSMSSLAAEETETETELLNTRAGASSIMSLFDDDGDETEEAGTAQPETSAPTQQQDTSALQAANTELVLQILDQYGWRYDYNAQGGYVNLGFNIEGTFGSCQVWIFPYDNGIKIQADYEIKFTEAVRDQLAVLFSRLNNELYLGNFYMDYENGYMGYEVLLFSGDTSPSLATIDYGIGTAIDMVEYFSDGIAKVMYGGVSVDDVFMSYGF